MKNTKGFTLIELLAVIVILAIIALIATPMILGVITDAKNSAAIASANGYIEAIEKNNMLVEINSVDYTAIAEGVTLIDGLDIQLKGDAPTSGWICISDEGLVTEAVLYFENISATKSVVYQAGSKVITVDYNATDVALPDPTTAVNAATLVDALQLANN